MADGKSKTVNFSAEGIEKLPKDKPVVYKIKNAQGENIYTGTSKRGEIQNRIKDHLPGAQDAIPGGARVQIRQMKSIADARKTESRIIARSKPRHNKKGR
jgi:excinuclease UvrABC nuclease subunit